MKKVMQSLIFPAILLALSLPATGQGSSDLNRTLIAAVMNDNVQQVQQLLAEGGSVMAEDTYGTPALTLAVSWAGTDMVKLLLDKGANIEAKDTGGATALFVAARAGKADVVRLLLDRGADIETKEDYTNRTPLTQAAEDGQLDVVVLLIERKANIEARDRLGNTPLIAAAENGNASIVRILIEKGANIQAKDENGMTALQCATETEVVQMLKQGSSQDPQSKFRIALHDFQNGPTNDEMLRENLFKAFNGLPTPPPIPDDARQLYLQASALIKQTSSPEDLQEPIDLVRKALAIAPWWGNAYYNLSRALELSGQYDEAVKQLNYYLEFTAVRLKVEQNELVAGVW